MYELRLAKNKSDHALIKYPYQTLIARKLRLTAYCNSQSIVLHFLIYVYIDKL